MANTWNDTGNYYVRIVGNNGADAPFQNFSLNVDVSNGSCVTSGGSPISLNSFSNDSTIGDTGGSNYQSVIVDNSAAMPAVRSGYSGSPALYQPLQSLATATNGTVVDLSQSAQVEALAGQAAQYPQCPYAADMEAQAIQGIINSYRVTPTNLKYVVIVGDDNVIPFFRYSDDGGLAPESNYQPPLSSTSEADAALQAPDYLSDDQYGAASELTIQGNPVPLPTASVGRLVETPSDIYNSIESYVGGTTVIKPQSSLVTGYDFMQPPATKVETAFSTGLPNGTNTTLITNDGVSPSTTGAPPTASWTAPELQSTLETGHYGLAFLGGHFSANNLLAADDTSTITTNQFSSFIGTSLENSLVISAGCHSGYGIDPSDAVPDVTDSLAWPQAFSEAGATLIAGTGYQYGDTNYVAYSDQFYVDLAQQLGYQPAGGAGPVPIGGALLNAEQEYLSGVDNLNALQEKALLQVTLYGLPMLGMQEPHQVTAPPASTSAVSGATPVASAPGNQLGLESAPYHVTPQLTSTTITPTGSSTEYQYEDGPQGVSADPGGPVLPVQTADVSVPPEVPGQSPPTLRGVGFMGGSYTDSTAKYPLLTGDPVTETSNSSIVPYSSSVFLPQTMWSPNYFSTLLNGGDTDLSFNPVQYESTPGSSTPTERSYSGLDAQLFYSNNTATYGANTPALASPPAISHVTSSASGDLVTVSANVTGNPSAGIQAVWVTYTGTSASAPLYGSWQSVELTQSATDSTLWTGSFTDANSSGSATSPDPALDSEFMVQAVNGVGEVTMDNNNGGDFTPTVTVGQAPAAGVNTYTLDLGGANSGAYLGAANLTATLTADTGDNASANVAGQEITFNLNGESVSGLTDSNGETQVSMPIAAAPGAYSVTAASAGDIGDAPASAIESFTVSKASTTLSMSAPATITLGASSGASATLTSGGSPLAQKPVFFVLSTPTDPVVGTSTQVTNSNGVAQAGQIAVPGGQVGSGFTLTASFGSGTVPVPGGGTYNATDPDYGSSTDTATVAVKQGTSGTTLAGTGTVVTGQSATFTAAVGPVSPSVAPPTGSVEFFETASVGSKTAIAGCMSVAVPASGRAACSTSFAASGSPYAITAAYSGDTNYKASSGAGTETVTPAATSTTVVSNHNPSVSGQPVTYTATVAVTAPGVGAPTGSVTFKDGTTTICSSVVLSASKTASCSATYTSSTGSPHKITAVYGGDKNFKASTSAVLTQSVNKVATTLVAAPAKFGLLSITFSATLTRSDTKAPLSGQTVTFSLLGRNVCQGTTASTGVAHCTITGLFLGIRTYTATYAGSTAYLPSNSTGSL